MNTCDSKKKKKYEEITDIQLKGKIEYDSESPILKSDIDTRLIDALGNLDKVEFIDENNEKIEVDLNGSLEGYRFRIKVNDNKENIKTFKILKYETDPNGFAGAIIQNEDNGHNILWADGSKGLKHFFKSPGEIIKDWIKI